jgi:nucleoside 2-deoxyribosyltransferase
MIFTHDIDLFKRRHGQMVLDSHKPIYVAGPLFSDSERRYLESLVDFLTKELKEGSTGFHINKYDHFFLPHRDAGDAGVISGGNKEVFINDLRHLDNAKIVIAWLDGADVDSGTAAELGYAFARGKQIFGLLTDRRRWSENKIRVLNNIVWGICKGEERIYKINIYETDGMNDLSDNKRLLDDLSKAIQELKIKLH